MKYYIFKGYTDSSKRYVPIIDRVKNCEVIDTTHDMIFNPPKVEKDAVLIGFSLGALVAFRISQKQKVKKLIACSITPLLDGDIDHIPQKIRDKHFPNSEKLRNMNYKNSKAQEAHFLCGAKEPNEMKKRSLALGAKLVPDTGHTLSKNYIKRILELI